MKPKGQDVLMEERFDDIFRRNLVAPEAREGDDKKRNQKAKYKFHTSKANKDVAQKLHEKNQKNKKRLEEKSKKGFTQNKDIILI
mmetsp:Transcript_5523/g.5047  ORF Transcript_5523/g.5047 Transcript_5523/m.5047 type:complete len:85 (+) Transcript_5523:956-1210(+)